jgi:Glycosyl transferase family 2
VTTIVDLVILSRDAGPLHPEVERGIRLQHAVQMVVHREVGLALPGDRSRCDAIARARNQGRTRGTAEWLMFLDDDVVLDANCVSTLVGELRCRPVYAALAADYLGERVVGRASRHVAMGATLFRRAALRQVRFAARGNRCECQCCCDDLRSRRWGIDYCETAAARHLPRREADTSRAVSQPIDQPLVTCLCVTSGRVELLKRAVQCFLDQTYPRREMVVVHGPADVATRRYLATVQEPSILRILVPDFSRRSLGALRNIARRTGSGSYVATWDDDDWSHPSRLEEQLAIIRETGMQGSVLKRLIMYDYLTKRAYVSCERPWENSAVVERSSFPEYPNVAKGEDTAVLFPLIRDGKLARLDRPDLYIYTFHGANTWNRQRWQRMVRLSHPIDPKCREQIAERLGFAADSRPQIKASQALWNIDRATTIPLPAI